MDRLFNFIQENQITSFLLLTFGFSLFAFSLMLFNTKWQTPENMEALPIWIIAVWSPSISAVLIWAMQRNLIEYLSTLFSKPSFSIWSLIVFVPVVVLMAVLLFHSGNGPYSYSEVSYRTLFALFALNLMLGPLGEEAGWRAFLFPAVEVKVGWMGAALVVGGIWAAWHAPLWAIESPQSEINFFIFVGHVFCYSILMSILHIEAGGSIIPVILFHLLVNVVSGYVILIGSHSTSEFYRLSLYYYFGATLIIVGVYELLRQKECILMP